MIRIDASQALQLFGVRTETGPAAKLSELAEAAVAHKQTVSAATSPAYKDAASSIFSAITLDQRGEVSPEIASADFKAMDEARKAFRDSMSPKELEAYDREQARWRLDNGYRLALQTKPGYAASGKREEALDWAARMVSWMQSSVDAMNYGLRFEGQTYDALLLEYEAEYESREAKYGADLAESMLHRQLDYADGGKKEFVMAQAELRRQFSLVGSFLSRDADGRYSLKSFEVTHPQHGLLVRLDAEGEMSMYEQDGSQIIQE